MNFKFSVRGPDRVSEELATVLSTKKAMEFKDIFDLVHASLLAKDYARGGEEMLRLRAHEKLQAFVPAGIVTKDQKKYKGVPKMLKEFLTTAAEFNARFASGTHVHPGAATKMSAAAKSTRKVTIAKLPVSKVKAVKRKTISAR